MSFDDDRARIWAGGLIMLAGCLSSLPAWFPRMRSEWNGGKPSGGLGFAGMAMFIAGLGAALIASGCSSLSRFTIVFIIFALSGWIVAAIGSSRDKRREIASSERPAAKDEAKQKVFPPRLAGLIIALFLGDFLYLRAEEAWTNYWLITDGKPGVAVVTKELWSGHNQIGYTYTVNHADYTGKSARNWKDPKYANVQIGEQSVVYYSASHPWISLLNKPNTLLAAWPVTLIVLILEFFAVMTVINPKSKWAFNLIPKRQA